MTVQVPPRFLPLREHQQEGVDAIVDAWSRVPVVIHQAPTGYGKTIGAVAAAERIEAGRVTYVCSGKQLQQQFARDFPDAAILQGRSNYPTLRGSNQFTAADCNKMGRGEDAVCSYCEPVNACPYTCAKQAALTAELSCINTTYLLTEANGPGGFSGLELGVLDEADVLESEMMRALEFRVGKRTAQDLGLSLPKKGVHRSTMVDWLGECAISAAKVAARIRPDLTYPEVAAKAMRDKQRFMRLAGRASKMGRAYDEDWVRAYESDGDLLLKPVTVEAHGQEMLWQHAEKWLVMSATIIAPDQFAHELGLMDGQYEFIDSPSTFPPENRPVVLCGVATMTKKEMESTDATERMVAAVQAVVDRHEGENVLVHSHTYDLARKVVDTLEPADGRRVFRYSDARGRDATVKHFIKEGGVLVAPSLTRGIDLPDDLCRVMVIIKAPFPYLGDPQVAKRLHRPGGTGQIWYDVQVAREVVQMTGRGVRHEDDWAVAYVLDAAFIRNIWARRKMLFPAWWREAVVLASSRQVLTGAVDFSVLESKA